jgi:hypothetical protein
LPTADLVMPRRSAAAVKLLARAAATKMATPVNCSAWAIVEV